MYYKQIPKSIKISKIIPIPKTSKNKSKFESYRSIATQNKI
jgi:hypothetical protein